MLFRIFDSSFMDNSMVDLGDYFVYLKRICIQQFGSEYPINISYVKMDDSVQIICALTKFLVHCFCQLLLHVFLDSVTRHTHFYDYLSSW